LDSNYQENQFIMKKTLLNLFFLFSFFSSSNLFSQNSVTVFDEILFYDGYAGVVNLPTPPGVIRHRNDLYAKKIELSQIASFGASMTVNVTIKAACDNYDRIGNVNIALVPKGAASYDPNTVQRIEIARYITPFMNKNVSPTEVPYTYQTENVIKILKDPALNALYDFWAELEVFGVPYAANTQVAGCAGRNDVFYGSLEFVSGFGIPTSLPTFLLPLNFKKDLNNYNANATDVVGQTVRTITFNLPQAITSGKLYLITSNHGANSGGEEYNRRFHYITFDGASVLTYKPGETTCEPYRIYNTQPNGIYGSSTRTPAQWQSFSNWCPGAKIPIRVITLGNLAAGTHTFKIEVPDAVFANGEGYFPISVYLQGLGQSLSTDQFNINSYSLSPNPATDLITIDSEKEVKNVTVFNMLGQQVLNGNSNKIDLSSVNSGMYLVQIQFENDEVATEKIIKK
jgi:hypothetical protein